MNKITLIIKREYLTRVRKKSFLLMSVLGPVIFAAFMVVPVWLASMEDGDVKTIAVADSSGWFQGEIPETATLKFEYPEGMSAGQLKKEFSRMGYYAVLFIPPAEGYDPGPVIIYSDKQPGVGLTNHISRALENRVRDLKLKSYNIENLDQILEEVKTDIPVRTIKLSGDGEARESHTAVAMITGYASGLLIYFFIFLFGAQVMRGVIEEKASRIIEVVISSVKPFQLMAGKIIGVGLVALTQFVVWILFTFVLVSLVQSAFFPGMDLPGPGAGIPGSAEVSTTFPAETSAAANPEMQKVRQIFKAVHGINFPLLIGMFIFFFLGGYLLYGSFFAAIGAAVDNEADTQQFMLPITIPLILALFVLANALNNPGSSIAFWFSVIPLTSPIVMMARIPFGVPGWEVGLSAGLLIMAFLVTTWLAGRIYRTGILLYGKRASFREIWKWLKYPG